MKRFIINTDGAAKGNPGPAGIGAVIKDSSGSIIAEVYEYLGETTNNQAEYQALIAALKRAQKLGGEELQVFADSELMVKQIAGIYKVKNEGIKPLFEEAKQMIKLFKSVSLKHVPREKNSEADALANKAIDEHFRAR